MKPSDRLPARPLVAALFVSAGSGFPAFLLGAASVDIKDDLGLNNTEFGSLVAGFMLMAMAATVPASRAAERLRASTGLRRAAVISGISLVATAVTAQSWAVLFVCISFGGMAMAIAEPAGTVLVVDLVPRRRLGLALGLRQASFPAAQAVSGLVVVALGATLGWRPIYAMAGGLMFAASLYTPTSPPHRAPHQRGARLRLDAPRAPLVVLMVATACGSATGASISGFIVATAVDAGLSPASAGLLFAFASALGFPLRLLFGMTADRHRGDATTIAMAAAGVGIVGHLMVSSGSPWAIVIGSVLALGFGWGWIGVIHLAVVRLNPRRPAAATGYIQFGNYLGAVIGPVVFGVIADRSGFSAAWRETAGLLVIAVICLGCARFMVQRHHAVSGRPSGALWESPTSPTVDRAVGGVGDDIGSG